MLSTVMVIIVIIIKDCKIVPNFLIGFEIFIPQIKYKHFTPLKNISYNFLSLFGVVYGVSDTFRKFHSEIV